MSSPRSSRGRDPGGGSGTGCAAGACRRRDWQGYARWPFARIARVVVLAGIAGVALVGAWRANDAFLIVAGLAMFLAGVDAAEGLAQEHDHPDRAELIPIPWGQLVLDHIVAPACALAIVTVISLTVFSVVIGSVDALVVSLIALVPIAIAAAVGAATSVVAGAPSPTLYLDFPFPEFGMIWLIMRQLIPPAIALTAMVPIAFAHDALEHHQSVSGAAISATLLPIGVIVVTTRWLQLTKARRVSNEAPLGEFPALETTDLTKSYGERVAVDGMNLSIERGELVALVGSNGAGKSTLLQLAAGLLDPTSGSVTIEGAEAGSLTARGLVSFIPDQPSLYDDLSVNEHIEYVARLHGLDGRPDTADELLELLELDGRADDLPARFSRGLRQKTSVAPRAGAPVRGAPRRRAVRRSRPVRAAHPGRAGRRRGRGRCRGPPRHPPAHVPRPGQPLHRPERRPGRLLRAGRPGRHRRPVGVAGRGVSGNSPREPDVDLRTSRMGEPCQPCSKTMSTPRPMGARPATTRSPSGSSPRAADGPDPTATGGPGGASRRSARSSPRSASACWHWSGS